MSYCRFENTVTDLNACVVDFQEARDDDKTLECFIESRSSEYEQRAVRKLYELCKNFIETYEEMEQF